MNLCDKKNQLLENESFQEDILNIDIHSAEERLIIQKKYDLSRSDLNYVYKFLSSLSFRNKPVPDEEVNYALWKFKKTIPSFSQTAGRNQTVFHWVLRIAAVLSVPLLLSSVFFYHQLNQQKQQSYPQVVRTYNTFKAPMGAKTQILLPDGTLVWLNSGSTLSFPSQFDPDSRKVTLEGEAYFEVVKNEKVPMIVSTGPMDVKVYGTKFNINTFDSDVIETTLVEGKVSIVSENAHEETILNPGFSAAFDPVSEKVRIKKVNDMEAFTGWKDGKLLFHDERFIQILKKLERWYNVNIQIADKSLYEYTLYATFIDENIEQVLDIFAHSIPISVEYPKRTVQSDGLYSKRTIIIKRDTNKILTKN
jgi:transmembrane sensor